MKRSSPMAAAPPKTERSGVIDRDDAGIVWLDARREGVQPATETTEKGRFSRSRRELGLLERELHDTVLQDLLCISLGLNSLQNRSMDEDIRREIEHLRQMAARAYDGLRGLVSGKSQTIAPPCTMRDVLANCVRGFNLKSGAEAELEVRDGASALLVSGEAARQAEMIVHEALCNAWRHGRARSIRVVLTETADIIWVKVMDDGKGFDTSIRKAGHYGLRIMQERAGAMGARVGITSSPGKGTCVNLYLPSHHSSVPTIQEVSHGYSFAGR